MHFGQKMSLGDLDPSALFQTRKSRGKLHEAYRNITCSLRGGGGGVPQSWLGEAPQSWPGRRGGMPVLASGCIPVLAGGGGVSSWQDLCQDWEPPPRRDMGPETGVSSPLERTSDQSLRKGLET